MMLPPVDVTPLLSNAFRYSSATDLRCSSDIVNLLMAIRSALQLLRALVPLPHEPEDIFFRRDWRERLEPAHGLFADVRERVDAAHRGPEHVAGFREIGLAVQHSLHFAA